MTFEIPGGNGPLSHEEALERIPAQTLASTKAVVDAIEANIKGRMGTPNPPLAGIQVPADQIMALVFMIEANEWIMRNCVIVAFDAKSGSHIAVTDKQSALLWATPEGAIALQSSMPRVYPMKTWCDGVMKELGVSTQKH